MEIFAHNRRSLLQQSRRVIGSARPAGVALAMLGAMSMAACAADTSEGPDEPKAVGEESLIHPDSPVNGRNARYAIPSLPYASGKLDVPGGEYSDADDLNDPPGHDKSAWLSKATSDPYSQAPAFKALMQEAIDAAEAKQSAYSDGPLEAAFKLFDDQIEKGQLVAGYTTYGPEQARWLEKEYVKLSRWSRLESLKKYPDPIALDDLRGQGGRLYCAARNAQIHQNGKKLMMGSLSPVTFSLFGRDIDLISIEPTVAFDGPERFTGDGANNGAQAFAVPLVFGTRLYPLKGLLPAGLGEIQYPTVLVSGDTEVRNGAEYRLIGTSRPSYGYSKTYRSLTHADAIYNVYRTGVSADRRIQLARVGPLAAELVLGMKMEVGDPRDDNDAYFNDRVLSSISTGLGLDEPLLKSRGGHGWHPLDADYYNDGAIRCWAGSGCYLLSSWVPVIPDMTRLAQNNDHHVRPGIRASMTGGIAGTFGGGFGGMEFRLSATGSLTGHVAQEHDLRDGVFGASLPILDDPMAVAVTDVVVQPRTSASANIDFAVEIVIKAEIDLPFAPPFRVTIVDKELFRATKDIASWDTDDSETWDRDTHLRLGYQGHDLPASEYTRPTRTYLPLSGGYDTFPGGADDVKACLADDPVLPEPPPACGPETAPTDTPSSEICLFEGGPPSEGICHDPVGAAAKWTHLWSTAEERNCVEMYIRYLCSGTSRMQYWNGQMAVAHRLPMAEHEPGALQDAQALNEVVSTCVAAFVGTDATQDEADVFAQSFFRTALCTSDAELLTEDGIVDVTDPNTDPPVVDKTPSGC